ncbi:winged helix-turn-helix domain-containing protein [Candidatus Woesearchaeota archaeon]|nr:winged helix-turn-helix domain-containing protein [Candidatus Woesearchaeota archaeon]
MVGTKSLALNEKDKLIVAELIKDPRISDNQISKNTGIPVKTINRRRHSLEEKGLLNYYSFIDNFVGTKKFSTRQMFVVRMNHGITRQHFIDLCFQNREKMSKEILVKHILESHLGEEHGQLVLVLILESFKKNDLIEIFNEDIVRFFEICFGSNIVSRTEVIDLTYTLSMFHNYLFFDDSGISNKPRSTKSIFVSE